MVIGSCIYLWFGYTFSYILSWYMLMTHQAPLFWSSYIHISEHICMKNCITDRWSKYTVTVFPLIYNAQEEPQAQVKQIIKNLLRDKYYRKSTHNTYARRVLRPDGVILEGMNDDGETGAAKCIIRELQLWGVVDGLVIVTRYFGGVMLHADRFRHVVDATRMYIKK